jgi:hypothetical protein
LIPLQRGQLNVHPSLDPVLFLQAPKFLPLEPLNPILTAFLVVALASWDEVRADCTTTLEFGNDVI